ncbi:MAG: 4Fe-4S binding protein [Thermodesulfovibrionales bacterium]
MNTDKGSIEGPRLRIWKRIPLSRLRRFVMLGIIVLFLLQFFRVKVLIGGLTGSLALWFVNLIDIFAFLENLFSSKDLTFTAIISVLPVIGIYIITGRAFCGWVCPMDFLFEIVDRAKGLRLKAGQKKETGYVVAAILLIISALIGIPLFTNYLSHLTNFFRFLTGGVFLLLRLPVEKTVIIYSGGIIVLLLILEYLFPRLWCRVFCPTGKVYGLFNKVSLIRLKFLEGECGECHYCEDLCYMSVKLTPYLDQKSLRDSNCIYCGRCVEACNTKGRLIKIGFRRNR